jgi:apolipoprotein N-acyltransferase
LGNVFASHPYWVQWYEYTGVSGGTLWILLVNIMVKETFFRSFKFQVSSFKSQEITLILGLIIVPLLSSYFIKSGFKKNNVSVDSNVLIIQPNIDPYQKFNTSSAAEQIQQLINLSEQNMDSATQLILWPETALSVGDQQDRIVANLYYQPVFDFAKRHPKTTIVSGIESFKMYGFEKTTTTARKTSDGSYYDAFNSAIAINAKMPLQFYNKSKLVPGVETVPSFLNFLAPIFEKFGGSTGGYGKDDSAKIFSEKGNPFIVAPVICYESIYGEYVGSYVKKGANIITILTNDGWWGNTPGHKQHLQYARLRAIETRRWVARSANTGISAVIDEKGQIITTQPWNVAASIKYNIPILNKQTVYVQYGDYLYKIASLFALVCIVWNAYMSLMQRFKK